MENGVFHQSARKVLKRQAAEKQPAGVWGSAGIRTPPLSPAALVHWATQLTVQAMPTVIAVNGIQPQQPAFLAPNATLVGDVRFGPRCSVWFGAVLRGDINHVALGSDCNVQDLCVLHVSRKLPCVLGDRVSMGHAAIAHACTVRDGALLGTGCRVLDGAVIGAGVLVAAGCVVPEGMTVPDHHLIAGVPGRVIKPLSDELRVRVAAVATNYVVYQDLYPELMRVAGG